MAELPVQRSDDPGMDTTADDASTVIGQVLAGLTDDLIAVRRELHAHPELSWHETRSTELVADRLDAAGWQVSRPGPTGLVGDLGDLGDLGDVSSRRVVALRADMDALPVHDVTDDPWRSTVDGVAHACGHDVHTAALLGAGLALGEAHRRGLVPGRVRLVFQPAEEVMPGGASALMDAGVLDGVERIFALHCDPGVDVGQAGLRLGALTSAADRVDVHLTGTGGHTSRPHLTGDLTFALAKVTTELPAVLSRRMDPRAGVSLVWGVVRAGAAPNVIPDQGLVSGTVRILDAGAWADCEAIVRDVVADLVRPYGVHAEVDYRRGVPPVVNEPLSHRMMSRTVRRVLGEAGAVLSPQSLGGEDFGWYLERVPGAMLRLGTRTPGGPTYDLHQGNLRVDERAVGLGARLLAELASIALRHDVPAPPIVTEP